MIILHVAPTANNILRQVFQIIWVLFLKICFRLINQTLLYARTSISMQAQSLLQWLSLGKQDIYVCSPRSTSIRRHFGIFKFSL